MAQEVTIRMVDDLDKQSEASETMEFTFDGVTYEIDLSEEHAAEFRGEVGRYIEAARRLGGRKRRVSEQPPVMGGVLRCPECGHVSPTRSALGSHTRSQHGASVAELEGKPAAYVCPDCDRRFSMPQGLGAHRMHMHGVSGGSKSAVAARAKAEPAKKDDRIVVKQVPKEQRKAPLRRKQAAGV